MTTDLFTVARDLDARRVLDVIPPACRRDVVPAHPVVDGNEVRLATPAWTPRSPARHFVPALSVLADVPMSFRFELSVQVNGGWSPWIASAVIGSTGVPAVSRFPALVSQTQDLRCDVDVFTTAAPVEAVRARVRIRADDIPRVLAAPWLVTLSACDPNHDAVRSETSDARVSIAVPPLSQMEAAEPIARRICSPACVAMVLRHWGRSVALDTLAAEIFHPALDLYGVWPAAVAAAARRGVAGYLLRFPDWTAARWCLDAGLPIVASVRYAAGELRGAAIGETTGHLIVLTGYGGDEVLVNDPAASRGADVARRYARADVERVWLGQAGVGYVFFDVARTDRVRALRGV